MANVIILQAFAIASVDASVGLPAPWSSSKQMHTIALDQMLTGRTSETEMSPQAPQQANEASIALHGWKHIYGEEPLRVGQPVTALFERHEQVATQNASITSLQ